MDIWFESNSKTTKAELLLGLAAAIAAVILSRLLQLMLPTHLRPLHDPMPAKRPCLFLLRIGHRGLAAIASVGTCRSVALLSILPRVYLGFHYPSDVVSGALLGIFVVMLVENYGPKTCARRAILFEHLWEAFRRHQVNWLGPRAGLPEYRRVASITIRPSRRQGIG